MGAELTKWLDEDNLDILFKLYNVALKSKTYYPCSDKANIVQIFKNGVAANIENYIPISLLQTAHQILAALMKNRILRGLDNWVTSTQYGFRPKAHAIFLARSLQDMAEREGGHLSLISLDWEKAFNNIYQDEILQVMERLDTPEYVMAMLKKRTQIPC